MTTVPVNIEQIDDKDSQLLWQNLHKIMELSDRVCQEAGGDSHRLCHDIYRLARDCRDLLVFDQVSRDTMATLTAVDRYAGLELDIVVKDLVRRNLKVDAIRELRRQTGCGLKEAKDAVDAYMNVHGIDTW